jgi:hypothetical protein
MEKNDIRLRRSLVGLMIFGAIILVIDIYQTVTGRVNANVHWPFFVSLIFIIGPITVLRLLKLSPADRTTVMNKAREDSFLNPSHIHRTE